MYEIDESQIRLWWNTFNPQGKLVEVRLLGKATYSGYFKNVDTLITQMRPYLDHNNYSYYGAIQAYYTLNELDEALYSREQRDTFIKKPKSTSTDANVTRRVVVMVDLDPQRVASVSSSDVEYEKAHLKAVEVYRYLMSQGFKEPIVSSSGNGMHLYLTCDMQNDDEHHELVKNFLKSLAEMFSDDEVELDTTVGNAARIDKIIGTWSKKGSDSKERPWRMSKFLKIPEDLTPNDESLFRKIADLLPKEEPKVSPRNNGYRGTDKFNLENWLQSYGIEYRRKQEGSSTKYEIKTCPWHENHSSNHPYSSALFQDADGKITYHCAHSHCSDKQWSNFRLFYEPNAYDRPVYQPQPQIRQYAPQKPRYEIKQETPELGKKWLQMKDVEKVDLSAIPRVRTGIAELDRLILGLAECELTVLSGGNASGKTSLLDTIILNAIEQGVPTAAYSGELPPHIFKAWIQMVAAGKDNLNPSKFGDGKFYVPNGVGEKIDRWLTDRFYLFNNEYGNSVEEVIHDMEELLEIGVRLFILDNMMSLDLEALDGGNMNTKQKSLVVRLKEFAKDNHVHVIVVAHPRKTTAFLRKNDISGTGDITNVADNVLIVHRVNQDFFKAGAEFYGQAYIMGFQEYGNVIEISKNRMYGVCDVLVGLHYEMESRRFKNTEYENIHYGWETDNGQMSVDFGNDGNSQDDMPFRRQDDEDAPF
jgi:KaiC/GvpD/RAD55 family RecA-like ATPase